MCLCIEKPCPCEGTTLPDPLPAGIKLPDEVRSVSATGGEKGTKLARFDLLPVGALREVAEHYGKGASKYADHNWRRGYEWSKSYAALQRHATQFWGGEDIDEETGSHHMAAVAFHALALLEFAERFPDFDDRFRAPAPEVDYPEEPLTDWGRELLGTLSTETPDPIGCIVTVTGDLGNAGHSFITGDAVRILADPGDGTLKCAHSYNPWQVQWVYEVDLG